METDKRVKIIEYRWCYDYGVHEIEDEPYQGSGLFKGTYEECIHFIQTRKLIIDWGASVFKSIQVHKLSED